MEARGGNVAFRKEGELGHAEEGEVEDKGRAPCSVVYLQHRARRNEWHRWEGMVRAGGGRDLWSIALSLNASKRYGIRTLRYGIRTLSYGRSFSTDAFRSLGTLSTVAGLLDVHRS